MVQPNQKAPPLKLMSTSGQEIDIHEVRPNTFSLLVFYRGYHCPVCKTYLLNLSDMVKDFEYLGVDKIFAISGDPKEMAEKSAQNWGISSLSVLYGQSPESMKEWGLYLSTAMNEQEPDIFGEPGLFLLDREAKVYYAAYNSMPFARPQFAELKKAIQYIKERDYPSRGRGLN